MPEYITVSPATLLTGTVTTVTVTGSSGTDFTQSGSVNLELDAPAGAGIGSPTIVDAMHLTVPITAGTTVGQLILSNHDNLSNNVATAIIFVQTTSVQIYLDPGIAPTGMTTLIAEIFIGGSLITTIPMVESPAGSTNYIGNFAAPGVALSYHGSVIDTVSRNAYDTFFFSTTNTGANAGFSGSASGLIIDQTSLSTFLFGTNLAILANQDATATVPDSTKVQQVINGAEGRVFSIMSQLQCTSGTFWKMPPTVNGVPLKSSSSFIALPLLQATAHQYAGFLVNKWRALLGLPEDVGPAINQLARAWEKDADANMRGIIRWAQGYTDGLYIELDLNVGAVVGAPYRAVKSPQFAGASVGPDGMPFRRIVNTLDWWTYPIPWSSAAGGYPYFALSE